MGYNIINNIPYREDESAKTFEKRPVIQGIMNYIRKNKGRVNKLLFLRWDRYSRDIISASENLKELLKLGVEPNAIEAPLDFNSDTWPLLLGVHIGSAQCDNIKRSKATMDGIHGTLAKGKCANKAPRGYKNVRISKHETHVEIDTNTAPFIQAMFKEVAKGIETPCYIRRKFARKGYNIPESSFLEMLRNKFYIGKIRVPAYKGEPEYYVNGEHEAIIDEETFYKVQEILDGKRKKTPTISFVLAAVLIPGTAAAFATSAQAEADNGDRATAAYGTNIQPDAELLAIGLTYQDSTWFYQGKAVAGMYDDNGGTYTNDAAAGDIYLAIKRGSDGKVTELAPITKKQFTELVDRHLNDVETEVGESSLMSYVDPTDGKTYYSFDDGKTFEPMTDEEFEARFPTPNVEWWTYDEYKAWLDNEKVQLQSLLGKTDTIGGQKFTWTQEEIDKTIAMYEETLSDIKNGIMYSKSVDGDYQLIMSYNPADISTSTDEKGLYIKLDNGKEYTFGPYETDEALLAAVKPFCEKQVRLGNMTQSEADEIIARHSGK